MVLILLVAFALRMIRLAAESLWYDETVSLMLAGKDVAALVAHTARDIHPPGYYLLLHAWQGVAGPSDFAAAFVSVFFGMLLVALAYRLAAWLFGRRAATIAALLVAVSPYNVWYSQEVRMYTLGAVLATLVVGATVWIWQIGRARGKRGEVALAVYAVSGALGLWTLYYFAFLLVAVNLLAAGWWLVSWRRWKVGRASLARWVAAQVAVIVLYLPWISIAWRQATDPPVPPWRSFTGAWDVALQAWTALGVGQSADAAWAWPALAVLAGLVVLGLVAARERDALGAAKRAEACTTDGAGRGEARTLDGVLGGAGWFLIGCVFVPVVLIYLASFVTPLFHVRYVFTYATPFYVVVAAGAAWLWRRWRAAGAAALTVVILLSGVSLAAYHASPRYAADDHRAAAAFLADAWRPGDAIVVSAGYAYPVLLAYWPAEGVEELAWQGRLVGGDLAAVNPCGGPALFLTGTVDGDPGLGWGEAASDFYAMTAAETEAALERLFATYHRVWMYRIYDTVADPEGMIRGWLDEHGTQFTDRVFTGEAQLRVQGYLTGRDPLTGPCPALPVEEALAGGSLSLAGMAPVVEAVDVGGTLDVAPVWQVGAQLPDAYLFAGLFDEEGRRWAQVDEQPAGPLYRTGAWAVGEMVRTPLRMRVPVWTPPGEYRLELGWYRFEEGQPVWLSLAEGHRLVVGGLRVLPPAAGWGALSAPQPAYTAGVQMRTVQLLGFDAPSLEGLPGETLVMGLYWQGGEAQAEAAPAVLRLVDGEGNAAGEWASAPVAGRAPFPALATGQVVRDPWTVVLPATIEPGIYTLELGRRTPAGEWLRVQRGPLRLGTVYPLATVRVQGRAVERAAPAPQRPRDVLFGSAIRFLGYDLDLTVGVRLTLYWQAVEPVAARYKIAVHLLGDGGPGDIRAQADVYPRLPTTSWLAGEYLADVVEFELPDESVREGRAYTLWLTLYEETTGARLPAYAADGTPLGDGLVLEEILLDE